MHTETIYIAEAAIQKQIVNERDLLWHYSHFRYLCWLSWKRSHKRM